ncbi:MAG: DUF72 domain-containing protein [Sphingomonadaceae bacterium]|nr:DUF72 domain-containing protein [Sphingomonadaceae bacterium]
MEAVVGTAGWSIGAAPDAFGAGESSLARYATRFKGVEINSSFHRPHRPTTWTRWAESVPADFRFAVKLPKTITHQRRLVACGELVDRFLEETKGLGAKLAILLVQLPPKFPFDAGIAEAFLADLASRTPARIACEPRHPSWFDAAAGVLLARLGVARVAADPPVTPAAALPGGWRGLAYWRLHGTPRLYRSTYGPERLNAYAEQLRAELEAGHETWCMFDNTASSAAIGDALAMLGRL